MKILIVSLTLLATLPGQSLANNCHSAIRTPNVQLIRVGDGEGAAWAKLGPPDRQAQLENTFGAGIGVAWIYYNPTKTTRVEISGSRVVALCETLH